MPESRHPPFAFRTPPFPGQHDISVEKHEGAWRVEVELGKIQAKDKAWSQDKLYIGARESGRYVLSANIFADNVSRLADVEVAVEVSARSEDADLDRIISIDRKRFQDSDEFQKYIRGDTGNEA